MTAIGSIFGSAFASAHDVFHSTAFHVAQLVTVFFVALLWLGLASWVHRDARRRVDDGLLVATATLLGLVPFLGPLVYLLFRPPETLEDAYARRVEVAALESRLFESTPHCPVCRAQIEPAFLVCPVCTTQLKEPCASCSAPLEPAWQACPYCTNPITVAPPSVFDLDEALTAEAVLHDGATRKTRSRRSRRPSAP